MLSVATGAITTTKFAAERLRAAASEPLILATDAADYLVRRGMPFRQAHDVIGKVLREAERQNRLWTQLSLDDLRKISPVFDNDFHAGLSVEGAIAAKSVPGGTAPDAVRGEIADLQKRITALVTKLKTKTGEKS
jgi:argininosuccinate lyase